MNSRLSTNVASGQGPKISVRCPACGHNGTFENLLIDLKDQTTLFWFGQRRCPNSKCMTHIFYIQKPDGQIFTYPQETIGFDKEGIPDRVLSAFEEAVKCHSTSCFIASAIMIRKTLEEVCADRGAAGDNLKKRLKDYGAKYLSQKN